MSSGGPAAEFDLSITNAAGLLPSEAHLKLDSSTMDRLCRVMDGFGMLATQYSIEGMPNDLLTARWRPPAPVLGAVEDESQWGIACHKLSLRGAWHVEAEECREALLAWEAASLQAAPAGGRPSCQEMQELVVGRYRAVEAQEGCPGRDGPCLTTWASLWGTGPDVCVRDFALFWFDWIDYLGRGSFDEGFEVRF
jgi:hypothetical protein